MRINMNSGSQWSVLRKRFARAHRCISYIWIFLVIFAAVSVSCSKKEPAQEGAKQAESLFGFYLGESREELFDRAEGTVSWSRLPGNKWDYRGDIFKFSGPLDGTEGIAFLRLAFFEDRLFEIIVYYSDTSRTMLHKLRREIEEHYGGTMTAPDGTVEMAYKTYRLSTPEKTITLRRITKHTGIELYVQYMHSELHSRLIQRKLEVQSE
jgi:hypothetical protein